MNRINLLPEEMRKRRRSGAAAGRRSSGAGVSPLVWIVLLVIIGGLGAYGFLQIYTPYTIAMNKKAEKEKQIAGLESEVKEMRDQIEGLAEIQDMVNSRLEVLNLLDPPDRLLWSEKLNLISDLRPNNVYIREIKLEEDVKEVETAESIRARENWERQRKRGKAEGKKPAVVTRPEITQSLHIYGMSYVSDFTAADADDQAINQFWEYQKALQTHAPELMEGLSGPVVNSAQPKPFTHGLQTEVKFGDWVWEEIAGRKVLMFELYMKSQPQLSPIKNNSDDKKDNAENHAEADSGSSGRKG